ncbi:MAG: twin-arginine translocase TatA/TatE family subunit [Planctomycetes bacterium]|nr:twin-arginine translocase TatA/TatE family subunit [Planctomycetota bacterium]
MESTLLAFNFGNIGPMELLLVGGIALLLFGRRIPEVMRSLGKGITEFKKGLRDTDDGASENRDASRRLAEPPPPPPPAPPRID